MTHFQRFLSALLLTLALLVAPSFARAQSSWTGVERIVVIGDLEGDYEKFTDMLRTAGLIDTRGNWSGGRTHLVQLGDIPDRGPNSRMVMDHLMRLEPQAERAGGYVHALIGNHEAMNVEGDLRYVHPGEYAAFADRNSRRLRDAYYRQTQEYMRANPPPTGVPVFDDAFRAQWEAEHPLGYVEHRQAWSPHGRYGRWIASHESVIRINDLLFLHAGIGPSYLPAERDAMNEAVRDALNGQPDPAFADILTNQEGPLWYRGLSLNQEPREEPHLAALLARHGVSRIIVGHTKRAATVLPRFGGRVIITDIARRDGYADPHAFLIIENGALTTIHRGHRVPLNVSNQAETCAYLDSVLAFEPQDSPLRTTASQCHAALQLPATAP
ncbi:metallophosphoesterase [Vitreimonas flagellata]|uniref:metallophosphoesterase n=1 Tax=Vitreimonas flagellata TaxID=2560861 RepID=UPI0010755470|nr:metallophosphoesterase [Vitreimonas flagellata]